MQYFRNYALQGEDTEFKEGTSDQRIVQSRRLTIGLCSQFPHLGISPLYCPITDEDEMKMAQDEL
jgi:hypothetical protein